MHIQELDQTAYSFRFLLTFLFTVANATLLTSPDDEGVVRHFFLRTTTTKAWRFFVCVLGACGDGWETNALCFAFCIHALLSVSFVLDPWMMRATRACGPGDGSRLTIAIRHRHG